MHCRVADNKREAILKKQRILKVGPIRESKEIESTIK